MGSSRAWPTVAIRAQEAAMTPRIPVARFAAVRTPAVRMRSARLRPAFALVAALLALPATTAHANEWDGQSVSCVKAFATPDKAPTEVMLRCADLFNAEARLQLLSSGDRAAVEKGLRWLYANGDDKAARVARDGLYRLEVRLPPREKQASGAGGIGTAPAPERPRYDPPEAKEADAKAADKLVKAGIKLLLKKKWSAAVALLESALQKNPRSEPALYNLACGEANLEPKRKDALKHLQNLADLGTDQSSERLIKSRSDADFEPIRDDPDYKRITGYMRIQVVNTIGRAGEPAIENIEKLFDKLGHKKRETSEIDKAQDHPTVLFKPHAKAQTALIAELLNHPRTRLDPIDFESKYDMIVRWGARVDSSGGETKVESFGPDTVDDSIANARKKQNKILAQPEGAINKVNKVVSTPERAYGQVEAMGKRVEGTVDKAKGAVEKMKSLGDKVNSL